MTLFPFSTDSLLIFLIAFFLGALSIHWLDRIYVPRATITRYNQVLNLSKQTQAFEQSLAGTQSTPPPTKPSQ